ncbi:MAG TPA: hypothetical protein P5330_10860 [Candidatus Competibacteraceae bacterium]|nr:hypothetical protein [Candidatus Competibacteraceae bacterium]
MQIPDTLPPEKREALHLLTFIEDDKQGPVWTAQHMTPSEIVTCGLATVSLFHTQQARENDVVGALLMALAWIVKHHPNN